MTLGFCSGVFLSWAFFELGVFLSWDMSRILTFVLKVYFRAVLIPTLINAVLTVSTPPVSISDSSLLSLWAKHYLPDLSTFSAQPDLPAAIAEVGRKKTADQIRRYLRVYCELASIETSTLLNHHNAINLSDARRLAVSVEQVYLKLLTMHERQLFWTFSQGQAASRLITLPTIKDLAAELDPVLAELKQDHLRSQEPNLIGFVTTQFHFTTRTVLKSLSTTERVLIEPYFRFAEEQICMPWQQICAAALKPTSQSFGVAIVQQFLPQCDAIAQAVYQRTVHQYDHYQSRRGSLRSPEIRASVLRDLTMFQSYLWLSVLEGNLETVQRNLLPTCQMVFPNLQVSWTLVNVMLGLLIVEIQNRCSDAQWEWVMPIVRSLQAMFEVAGQELETRPLA